MPNARALLLAPEPPFPAVGGGPLRSASICTYLGQRYALDVITFRQPGAPDPRDTFPTGLARSIHVIELAHHSKSAWARIARNLNRALRGRPPLLDRFSGFESEVGARIANQHYDLGVIEHFWCAPYAPQLRPACARLLLDLHNIESNWHATLAESGGLAAGALHRRFAHNYRALEIRWLPRFDDLIVTSAADARRVSPQRCIIYPNSIPFTPKPLKTERHEIIFTGNLEYQPNFTAILHFRDRIWPGLRKRWPELIWTIGGKNSHVLQGLVNDERIRLTGPMDDAIDRIAQSQVAIVPLLAGSGTRVKIIEAWAAATPVVSTSIGAEGLDYQPGEHLILADSPLDFSSAVSVLLSNHAERTRIGEAGRALYELSYTWERAWKVLDAVLGIS